MCFKFVFHLLEHIAHLNSQCLAFLGTGNDASVIIAQHNDRFSYEVGMKESLTGTIKVIAISQSEEFHTIRICGNAL